MNSKHIVRKYAAAGSIASLLLSGAIATAVPAVAQDGDGVEIDIWFAREQFIPGDRFETFHAENPGITVNFDVIPLETSVPDFIRNARAGQQPDIFQAAHYDIGPAAEQGLLLDLTDHFAQWEQEDPEGYGDVAPWGFELGEWKGVPYGLGVHGGSRWLVYDKQAFDAAGLSAPETWDDVIAAGKELSSDDMVGFSMIGARTQDPLSVLQMFSVMGGEWIDDIPQIDSEAGHYLISIHQQMAREGLLPADVLAWESGEMRAAFIGGRAAMAHIGYNIFPTIEESRPYGESWEIVEAPARPGAEDERTTVLLGYPYYVDAATEHPEAVAKVLRYLARADIVKEVAMRYQPSSTVSVYSDPDYIEAQPWGPSLQDKIPTLSPIPVHIRFAEMSDVIKDLLQEMLTDTEADPAEMAARYQERLEQAVRGR